MINKFAALLLIGMAAPYQILDWYGGRHTGHTASGALAQQYLPGQLWRVKTVSNIRSHGSRNTI